MNIKIFRSVLIHLTVLSVLLLSQAGFADYIAGEEANRRGDRDTAFKEFYNAAENKDARAYGKLGSMYLYGLGTPKDYRQAYIWFHMAWLSGDREGERFRDAASSTMNRKEYLEAVEAAEQQRLKLGLEKTPEH